MPYENMPGSFGSNRNRNNNRSIDIVPERRHGRRARIPRILNNFDYRSVTPERWVDIVCCFFLAVFLIVVVCNWHAFSESLFQDILFPIIYVGSRILAFVAVIGAVVGVIYAKFCRRRYWW